MGARTKESMLNLVFLKLAAAAARFRNPSANRSTAQQWGCDGPVTVKLYRYE
jgi:hypothetical protein